MAVRITQSRVGHYVVASHKVLHRGTVGGGKKHRNEIRSAYVATTTGTKMILQHQVVIINLFTIFVLQMSGQWIESGKQSGLQQSGVRTARPGRAVVK